MPSTFADCVRVNVLRSVSDVVDPERHRLEVAPLRLLDQRVEVAVRPEQPARRLLGDPALDLRVRLAARRQLELLAAPARLHGVPRITGRRRRVNDDRAAAPCRRRALVLVDPAPVEQTLGAGEQLRIPVGIVVQHQQHLAAHVDALEVVPVVLGRLDAVADEHDLRVLDRRARRLHAARRDEVGVALEVDASRRRARTSTSRARPPSRRRARPAAPTSRSRRRARSRAFASSLREIRARHLVAGGARRAADVAVVGDLRDDAADVLAADRVRGRDRGRRDARRRRRCCGGRGRRLRARSQRSRGRARVGVSRWQPASGAERGRERREGERSRTADAPRGPRFADEAAQRVNRRHAGSTIPRRARACPRSRSRRLRRSS